MGFGNSFSTPASSHLLAHHSPKKFAPLIFSIKQTGVPVGGLIAVVMVQVLVDDDNVATWPDAFLATGLICLALMVILQPMRRQFDANRQPGYPVRFSDGIRNIRTASGDPNLRNLCMGMFAFVGLQGLFNSIFATFAQLDLGMDKRTALDILVVVNITAALSRILWGWIGSSLAPSRIVLSALAFLMGMRRLHLVHQRQKSQCGSSRRPPLRLALRLYPGTGLLLSEVARMAPPGQVGPSLVAYSSFGALGMLSYPFMAKQLLNLGIGYDVIFYVASIPRYSWASSCCGLRNQACTPTRNGRSANGHAIAYAPSQTRLSYSGCSRRRTSLATPPFLSRKRQLATVARQAAAVDKAASQHRRRLCYEISHRILRRLKLRT